MRPALLLAAALLAGCATANPPGEAARPAGLSVSVGGSVGMAGAVVSQSR
jgi:predicted small secreted protein